MKFRFLLLLLTAGSTSVVAQTYGLYSDEKLSFESKYLEQTIELNLHLPETQPYAAESTRYPITIIFDSQHERTYPQIIGAIDLLTSETQVPESIIIGVPYNIRNRKYFTSQQKMDGDELSGIERTERFLFEELIPHLQQKLNGSDFVALIGHSRTAFLVNYLVYTRSKEVNLAIALSGFYNDDPLTLNAFCDFLCDSNNFTATFQYYHTAGTTSEDESYLIQCRKLDSLLALRDLPEQVKVKFSETPNANHMSNYWVSLPPLLMESFSEYNSILNSWFHEKLPSGNPPDALQLFTEDLMGAGTTIGTHLNPNLTHIYSLASHFKNDQETFETAIDFFDLGLQYFPEYLEFYVEIIEICKQYDEVKTMRVYKEKLREKIENTHLLTDSEKEEYREYLDSE